MCSLDGLMLWFAHALFVLLMLGGLVWYGLLVFYTFFSLASRRFTFTDLFVSCRHHLLVMIGPYRKSKSRKTCIMFGVLYGVDSTLYIFSCLHLLVMFFHMFTHLPSG